MGWIDIVFIAIIVLFAIIGLAKGLFESILSIFSTALSIVVAILASKYVAAFLDKVTGCNKFFADKMVEWGWVNSNGLELFGKVFTPEQLANACTVILSILAVWLLIKLAILLLSKLFDSATSSSGAISGLNRVLGLIFGAAKGFLIGCIALALVSILTVFKLGGNIKAEIEKNKMTNFVYKYINEWVANTLDNRIEDILGKGETPTEPTPETGGGEQGGQTTPEVVAAPKTYTFENAGFVYKLTDTRNYAMSA